MQKPELESVWEFYGGSIFGAPGGKQRAKCPMHQDNNASAVVDLDEQKWSCFTCDAFGDAIDVIQIVENLSFKEAVKRGATEFDSGESGAKQGSSSTSGGSGGLLRTAASGRRGGNWVPAWKRS